MNTIDLEQLDRVTGGFWKEAGQCLLGTRVPSSLGESSLKDQALDLICSRPGWGIKSAY